MGSKRRALAAEVCLCALLALGCVRLDVTEGGQVAVEPAGTACPEYAPPAPMEPERVSRSCHLYVSNGIPQPGWVTFSAVPAAGFAWTGWTGAPAQCATNPVCRMFVLGPTWIEAVFEPLPSPFTPDAIHVGTDGIAYLAHFAGESIQRYSLTKRRWLAPLAIGPNARFMTYMAANHRLYLAFANGSLSTIDLARSRELLPFQQLPSTPLGLTSAGAFVVTVDARTSGTHTVFRNDGVALASRTRRGVSRDFSFSPVTGRLYHSLDGSTRNDLAWEKIDPVSGIIAAIGTTPYTGDFPVNPPIRVANDGARVLLGSGDLYDGVTLERVRSLPTRPVDALWSDVGLLALVAGSDGSARLEQWGSDFQLRDVVPLGGTPLRVLGFEGATHVVTLQNGRPVFRTWQPDGDGDHDGVAYAADDFPLDPAASRDTDADGFPDAWNPGKFAPDSTTGLALDAFPLRSACQAPEDATNGICDAEVIRPAYLPKAVVADAAGVVYALGAEHRRIDRWAADGRLLDPIRLRGTPRTMVYAEQAQRLVIANADLSLTKVELAEAPRERPFAATATDVRALGMIGPVLVAGSAGSKPWHLSFAPDGTELAARKPFYAADVPGDLTSSRSGSRAYGTSQGYLHQLALDAQNGAVVQSYSLGNWSVAAPVRVDATGAQLFTGPRSTIETKYLTQTATFAVTALDAAWLDHGLLTMESVAGGSARIAQWSPKGLYYAGATFPGSPLRVLRSGSAAAVLTLQAGRIQHALFMPTLDVDGDGVANSDDAFALDPAAALDSDGDGFPDAWIPGAGPGDSSSGLVLDAFPQHADCWLATHARNGECDFGRNVPVYTPSDVEIDREGVVYLLSPQNRKIFRWSLDAGYHLEAIRLPETPVDFAYVPQTHRLHVAYKDGRITRIDPGERPQEHSFAMLPAEPFTLTGAARFLLTTHRGTSSTSPRSVFDADGAVVATGNGNYVTRTSYSAAAGRYYYVSTGSPADVVWQGLDPESGALAGAGSSPYHGNYPILEPVRVSRDGTRVIGGSGDVYDADSLVLLASLPATVTDGNWSDDGNLTDAHWIDDGVLTVRATGTGSTRLERWSLDLELRDFATYPGTPLRVLGNAERQLVVTLVGGRPTFHEHVRTDDADGDGVDNLHDAFAEDPAASVDSDRDGWPDAWNAGHAAGDSTSGLELDAFPVDSACQLPAHGPAGVCDVALATPPYRPDEVVQDQDGTLYLLSKERARIFRHHAPSGTFLNPIVTSRQPIALAHSDDSHRLYVGYPSGAVEQIDLARSDVPERFNVLPGRIFALAAAGPILVIADTSDGQSLHTYAPDGHKLARFREHPAYTTRPWWSGANRGLYFFTVGSPSHLVWEEVAENGSIGARHDSPYHGTYPLLSPIRVTQDAGRVLLGSGDVYDATSLALEHRLGTPVSDAVWLGDELLTLEPAGSGQSRVRLLTRDYRALVESPVSGDPIALREHAGHISVITLIAGRTRIAHYVIPDDGDGDGVSNREDAFPLDPAASLDGDGDGWPDAWNPGRSAANSTTGLQLDAYPGDFGCQLAQHGVLGVCDVARVLPAAPQLPLCSLNPPVPATPAGTITLAPSGESLAFCGGWLFVADPFEEQIVLRNAFDGGRVGRRYPLPSKPADLELDRVSKTLYATLPALHAVAVIDLTSSQTTVVPLPEEPAALAAGAMGELFVTTRTTSNSRGGHVFRVAAGAASADGGWPVMALLVRYNSARAELVIADQGGYSPSYLRRYGFDAGGAFTLLQERRDSGGGELELSPTGDRILANGPYAYGYSFVDFDPANLESVNGVWDTGYYPASAAFSPNGAELAATNWDDLIVFDVASHAEIGRFPIGSCAYGTVTDLAYEPSGRYVLGQESCGTAPNAFSMIHWQRVAP